MPQPQDIVSLVVDGHEYRDWTAYDIDSSILVDADSWSLQIDGFWEGDLGVFQPGVICELYVNDWRQMVGVVEEIDPTGDKSGSKMSIGGRSLAGILVDASPEPGRMRDLTILEAAQRLCDPYGLEVVTTDAARTLSAGKPNAKRSPQVDVILRKAGIKLEDLQPQTGDSIWGFLAGIAEKLELAMWLTADGKVCISRPTYVGEPLYALYRGRPGSRIQPRNNIISGGYKLSWANRFSHYIGVGQAMGTKTYLGKYKVPTQISFTETIEDPEVSTRLYKPLRQSYNVPSRARLTEALNKEVAKRKWDSFEVKYTVDGHSQNHIVWEPDTLCLVNDEVLGLDEVLYVVARRFTRSKDAGTRTELTLRRRGLWLA